MRIKKVAIIFIMILNFMLPIDSNGSTPAPEKINIIDAIKYQENRQEAAHNMAEAARVLGYSEDNSIIRIAQSEWEYAERLLKEYREKVNKYYTANYVWNYLTKTLGYNEHVATGIIGNMMVEAGGHTLNIDATAYNEDGYYGICQWSSAYGANGSSLDEQCVLLKNTIQEEFNNFGFVYSSNFDYKSFLEMTNEREAAIAFAKCYERCHESSYDLREECAAAAYEYFMVYQSLGLNKF